MMAVGTIRFRSAFAALGLGIALCGCGDGIGAPADGEQEGNASNGMPPIYVDLVEEEIYKGENAERTNYRDMLERCRNAGFPTTPLTPDQVELLGKTRVQLWFDAGHQVLRREDWTFSLGDEPVIGECHFQLKHSGGDFYSDASVSRSTDFATGDVESEPPQAHTLSRFAVEMEGDLQQIAAEAGLAAPTSATVAEAQCTKWTTKLHGGQLICLWSGGRQWGFHDSDPSSGCSPEPLTKYADQIVLSEEPLAGSGCRITTRSFSVGKPFGPGDYQLGAAPGATE